MAAVERQSLTTYYGGFLLNAPCPLELSLNVCSHHCPFCFANLNKPNRVANTSQIFGLFKNAFSPGKLTLEKHLLRSGYPIQFSNHIDPFAGNNYELSLRILETLSELDVPCSLQTKGGHGLLKKPNKYHCSALDLIKPTVFYVSLETLDDDIGKKVSAPGAPRPSLRLEMIETLIAHGHRVCVGVNPVVPQWLPDPELMVTTLHSIGVEGIWIQPLHLSHKQISKMSVADKKRLGDEILDMALPRNHKNYPAIAETLSALRTKADEIGLAVYDNQQPQRTEYFKPYIETYPTRYPMMQEFVNWCHDSHEPGDLIYFEAWLDLMLPSLPDGVWPIGQHIGAVAGPGFWSKTRDLGITNQMTYQELLGLIWDWLDSVLCPANVGCFQWAGDYERQSDGTKGWSRWTDKDGHPILVFNPEANGLWSQQYL